MERAHGHVAALLRVCDDRRGIVAVALPLRLELPQHLINDFRRGLPEVVHSPLVHGVPRAEVPEILQPCHATSSAGAHVAPVVAAHARASSAMIHVAMSTKSTMPGTDRAATASEAWPIATTSMARPGRRCAASREAGPEHLRVAHDGRREVRVVNPRRRERVQDMPAHLWG